MGRFAELGKATVEIRAPLDKYRNDLNAAQVHTKKSTQKMVGAVDKLRLSISRARANVLAYKFAWAGTALVMGAALKTTTAAAIEQERVVSQLNARLRSTGMAAGLTSAELQLMAASMQRVTTFGDEVIIGAQSMLLSFTKIGKNVFPQALTAALNLAEAFGGDLQSAVIQVGKALNDPVIGVTALQRVGITFTESQKSMIKELAGANDMLGAQTIILKELETQFGKSAVAARDTFGGRIKALGGLVGDQFERMGNAVLEHFDPAIKRINKALEEMSDNQFLKDFGESGTTEIAKIGKAIELETLKIIKLQSELDNVIKRNISPSGDTFENVTIRNLREEINLLEESRDINITRLKAEKGVADALDVVIEKRRKLFEDIAPIPSRDISQLGGGLGVDPESTQVFADKATESFDRLKAKLAVFKQDFQDSIHEPMAGFFESLIKNTKDLEGAFQVLLNAMNKGIADFLAKQATQLFFKLFLRFAAFVINPGLGTAISVATGVDGSSTSYDSNGSDNSNGSDDDSSTSYDSNGSGSAVVNIYVGEDRLAQAMIRSQDFENRTSVGAIA